MTTLPEEAMKAAAIADQLEERTKLKYMSPDGEECHIVPLTVIIEAAKALRALPFLSVQGAVKASERLSEAEKEITRYQQERERWINYTMDLQRIIEALCDRRGLPEPLSTARHHYDMAREYLSSRAGNATRILSALEPSAPDMGNPITLTYTNYRGETSERTITPIRPWFGSTEWHPEPQWLLRAYDHDKRAERDFALKDFGRSEPSAARELALEEIRSFNPREEVEAYEFRGDNGDYTPSEAEKVMLEDFAAGLLGRIEDVVFSRTPGGITNDE